MGKTEQYRRYAAECVRLAHVSEEISEKDVLLSMAAAWCRLADHAEKNGNGNDELTNAAT